MCFNLTGVKALTAWFYPGQPEVTVMSMCRTVVSALAGAGEGEVHE